MQQKKTDILKFLTLVVVIIAATSGSYYYSFKIDVTEDQRFTLKDETKNLLKEVDDIITFKIYLEGNQLPVGFVKLKNSIREILKEFTGYAGESIEFEFIDLFEIKSREKREREIQRLTQLGIPYVPVKQQKETTLNEFYVIPGAEVTLGAKNIGVNLLENNPSISYQENFNRSIEALEYQLSNAIRKLLMERPKNVAFLQGHGESGQVEVQDLAQTLSEYYIVGPILLSNPEGEIELDVLDYIDLLIISKPTYEFNTKELYVLDQFVLRGGKLLVALDGSKSHLDSLRYSNFFPAMPLATNLEDLLFNYGVRLNQDLVQDIRCTQIPLQPTGKGSKAKAELAPWVFFPLIFSEDNHLINRKLNPLKLEFASSLTPVHVEKVVTKKLLETSGRNKYLKTPTRIGFEEAVSGINPNSFTDSARAIAVLLEGNFPSYFKNRPPVDFNSGVPHINVKKTSAYNNMVVISDGDFGINPIISGGEKALPLGTDRYNQNIFYDNKRFLLNAVNYLLGDEDLIPVRSKKIEMRLLDKNKLKNNLSIIKIINLIVPVGLVIIIGLFFHFLRRRAFT